MPNKFLNNKGIEIKKQKYKLSNWSEYNEALKRRGDVEIWLCQEVIDDWLNENRTYNGTGTPNVYTHLAIITCHQIRKVFRLPSRRDAVYHATNHAPKPEAMIACGVLNKMTSLGMPKSYKI